jgi:hypothetical protein
VTSLRVTIANPRQNAKRCGADAPVQVQALLID